MPSHKSPDTAAAEARSMDARCDLPTLKPFRVSAAYVDWAHSSAADDGQERALAICNAPELGTGATAYKLVEEPQLVAELADVAELFVGGRENDLRAAKVRARALQWLRERGLTVRQALKAGPYPSD